MVDLFGRFGELRNSFLLKGDRNVLRYVFQTISGSGTEIEYHMLITINSTVVGLYSIGSFPRKYFYAKYFYLVVEMSRHLAGPGGGSAYCGEVGGLARADIRMEHCNTLSGARGTQGDTDTT